MRKVWLGFVWIVAGIFNLGVFLSTLHGLDNAYALVLSAWDAEPVSLSKFYVNEYMRARIEAIKF